MNVKQMREQRAHLHAEMSGLIEAAEADDRDFTGEEQEKYDKMEAEFRSLRTREDRSISAAENKKEIDNRFGGLTAGSPEDGPKSFAEYRRELYGTPTQDSPDFQRAFWRYMATRRYDDIDTAEFRVLSKASGAVGGFLVPTEMENEIIRAQRFQGSVASLANVYTTSTGDALNLPVNSAHGSATWTAESAAYTASDETFANVAYSAYKAGTLIIVSEELLEDSAFPLDSFLSTEFGERISVLEETAYVIGSGTGQPQGLLSSATASNITTVTAATGNATSFTYDAIVTAIFSLPTQYRQGASFIVNDQTARNLYLLKDSQNRPLWAVNLAANGPDTFLGYPIYTHPDVPAPAANNISMLFGNWRRTYTIRRVAGFGMQRLVELYAANGQVGFRGYERVDGRVVLAAAGIAHKHSAT